MVLSICCRSTCLPKLYVLDYLVFLYSSLLGFLWFCFVVLLSCCNVALLCCCLVFLFLYNTLQLSMENVIESGGCHCCSPKRQAANGQLYNSSCKWPALQLVKKHNATNASITWIQSIYFMSQMFNAWTAGWMCDKAPPQKFGYVNICHRSPRQGPHL